MRTKEFTVMRYVAVLASILAVLTVMSAVPYVVSDTSEALDPDDYVSPTETVVFNGLVGGYDTTESSVVPKVFIFVVVFDAVDTYYYVNVNDGKMLSTDIVQKYNEDLKEMQYVFSIEVPQIIDPAAEYYICVFNNYKIDSVPATIKTQPETVTPDDTSWGTTKVGDYKAYMIKHDTPWTADQEVDLSQVGTETGYKIGLTRAEGTITRHVNGMIGTKTSDLGDVLVRFFRNDDNIRSVRTDSNGNYSATLPTGDYEVRFSRGNYTSEPVNVTVNEGNSNVAPDVTMTLKVENDFFGQDLSHFLTIVGGVVCGLIILISIAFQWRRIKQKKSGKDWILDDMEEMDEE